VAYRLCCGHRCLLPLQVYLYRQAGNEGRKKAKEEEGRKSKKKKSNLIIARAMGG